MFKLVEGFDHFSAAQAAMKKWTPNFDSMIAGVNGFGQACRTSHSSLKTLDAPSGSNVFMLQHFQIFGTTGTTVVFQGYDGGTCQFQVAYDYASGKFKFYRGDLATGTLLGTSDEVDLIMSVWHLLELQWLISDSSGSVIFKVDSTPVFALSGADTKQTGNANITRAGFGGGAASDAFDDFLVWDSTGAAPTGFVGDCRVGTDFAIADGTHSDWLPSGGLNHWSNIDETNPNASDSVSTATVGAIDTYQFPDMPDGANAPLAVQINIAVMKNDAGPREVSSIVTIAGTDYAGPSQPCPATLGYLSNILSADPSTAAAWTVAGKNAADFGQKVSV